MAIDPGKLTNLKHHLQFLKLPGDDQLRIIPDGFCKADEMALDDENWSGVVLGQDQGELSNEQRLKIAEIDLHFSSFSGGHNAILWTDDAVRNAPEWARVRVLASEA